MQSMYWASSWRRRGVGSVILSIWVEGRCLIQLVA